MNVRQFGLKDMPITHVFIGHLLGIGYAVDTLSYSRHWGTPGKDFIPSKGDSKHVNKCENKIIPESGGY